MMASDLDINDRLNPPGSTYTLVTPTWALGPDAFGSASRPVDPGCAVEVRNDSGRTIRLYAIPDGMTGPEIGREMIRLLAERDEARAELGRYKARLADAVEAMKEARDGMVDGLDRETIDRLSDAIERAWLSGDAPAPTPGTWRVVWVEQDGTTEHREYPDTPEGEQAARSRLADWATFPSVRAWLVRPDGTTEGEGASPGGGRTMSNVATIVRNLLAWPSGPGNSYAPWPAIARRLLFCPVVYAGLALALVGVGLGWGWGEAVRFWRDAR